MAQGNVLQQEIDLLDVLKVAEAVFAAYRTGIIDSLPAVCDINRAVEKRVHRAQVARISRPAV